MYTKMYKMYKNILKSKMYTKMYKKYKKYKK